MNNNSYPVYSNQEQTLAFSVSFGLIVGELFVIALCHPMLDFSQFLLRRNHLDPFMIYFLALRQIEWVGFTMQRSSCVPNRS